MRTKGNKKYAAAVRQQRHTQNPQPTRPIPFEEAFRAIVDRPRAEAKVKASLLAGVKEHRRILTKSREAMPRRTAGRRPPVGGT